MDVKAANGNILEEGYFDHPLSILKIWEGGLASHGAAIVILIMLYVYSKKVVHRPMLWILHGVLIFTMQVLNTWMQMEM